MLLLYVRMNELPRDVLLTDPTMDFRNDFALARAAVATLGSARVSSISSSVSSMLEIEALLPPICFNNRVTNPVSLSTDDPKMTR
jgi:hypothetical protein